MATTDLTLKLPDKTFKKLRALAMLSGSTVPELEEELLGYFDEMLSANIATLLAQMDGKETVAYALRETPVRQEADVDVSDPAPTPEREDTTSHSLSSDDDTSENKSLAEQVEQGELSFDIQAPDSDGDPEKFLDVAMTRNQTVSVVQPAAPHLSPEMSVHAGQGKISNASRSFSHLRPRATISDATDSN